MSDRPPCTLIVGSTIKNVSIKLSCIIIVSVFDFVQLGWLHGACYDDTTEFN